MLGTKRTIPFWRPKRRLLSLERALSAVRDIAGKAPMPAPALVAVRARSRLATESRKKGRFTEG